MKNFPQSVRPWPDAHSYASQSADGVNIHGI